MGVPLFAEIVAIFLDVLEEQLMQQPEVVRVTAVKEMKPFKAGKKGPPSSGKVPTTFKPEAFYTCVMG